MVLKVLSVQLREAVYAWTLSNWETEAGLQIQGSAPHILGLSLKQPNK